MQTIVSPSANPASQARSPLLGAQRDTNVNSPTYPATRTKAANARPASSAQIIDSAVSAPRPTRQPPATIADPDADRNDQARATIPTATATQTAIVAAAVSLWEEPPFASARAV